MKTGPVWFAAVLLCVGLVSGCASWQAQFLRGTSIYPAFPDTQRLVGTYGIFSTDEYPENPGGPTLELLSDGSYYEEFLELEHGQVFIVDSGRWRSHDGHLSLESDHRAIGQGHPRTEPDYAIASTLRDKISRLRLLPAGLGSFRGGQLVIRGQLAGGNFLSDKLRERSDFLYQINGQHRDEVLEKKKIEELLRESNYRATHPR